GRPPWGAGPAAQSAQRQLAEPLALPSQLRPSLSEAVDAVLAKALAPAARRRWTSASTFSIAVARALDRLADEPPVILRVPPDPIHAAQALLRPTAGTADVRQAAL